VKAKLEFLVASRKASVVKLKGFSSGMTEKDVSRVFVA
jgi:hypothetical protein